MAILNINLDPELHQKLKNLAKKDERSLTNYIIRTLRAATETDKDPLSLIQKQLSTMQTQLYQLQNQLQNNQLSPLSPLPPFVPTSNVLPKNVTATYKIKPEKDPYENMTQEEIDDMIEQKQIEAFQTRAKTILGQKLDIAECNLTPDNRYYAFAEPQEGKYLRWAYTMPIEKQKEYLEEWKQYLD